MSSRGSPFEKQIECGSRCRESVGSLRKRSPTTNSYVSLFSLCFSLPPHSFPPFQESEAIRSPGCEVRQVQIQCLKSRNQGESVSEKNKRQWRRCINSVDKNWLMSHHEREERDIYSNVYVYILCVCVCMYVCWGSDTGDEGVYSVKYWVKTRKWRWKGYWNHDLAASR